MLAPSSPHHDPETQVIVDAETLARALRSAPLDAREVRDADDELIAPGAADELAATIFAAVREQP